MKAKKPKPAVAKRNIWKWLGGAFTALVAVAGFASAEFRAITCLDLPEADDLEYAAEPSDALSFNHVSANSQQSLLDGKPMVFRARYFGETLSAYFAGMLGPERQAGYAYLNLRPVEFVAKQTPLGSTASELPAALVLVASAAAGALTKLEHGALIEVRGKGHYLSEPEAGSPMAVHWAAGRKLPDANDFYVLAENIQPVLPSNPPESRMLCRAFHKL